MKLATIFTAICFLLVIGTAGANAQETGEVSSSMEWKATTIDFGEIEQGNPVTAEFEFSNESMVPLIVNSVQTSCGCTVADYPKEPILPGEIGTIAVTFNAAAIGPFQKSVLVQTNATEGYSSLIIKGDVAVR